jgi:hypothetical protein
MDDLLTRAQLVRYDPALAAIGTVVPRAEFAETAARGEFPATLFLDLDRVGVRDGEGTTRARVSVEWDQDTLNRLLAATEDEEIALWFDERELARAFDEVEAHGLRERAAMLAIAVAAAGASATPALASEIAPSVGGTGSAQSSAVTATAQAGSQGSAVPMGVERAQQLNQQLGAVQSQSTQGSPVQSMGTQRGEQLNQQVSAGGAQSPSAESPAVTSTGGNGLSAGELAAIAGAGAILISAAGFGIARKHTPPVQPA